ncbi:MAG TPA: TonB-dependent receptor, partial [Telluria sp.]|nr:TonB-dependent receptor [Telluria sp.]
MHNHSTPSPALFLRLLIAAPAIFGMIAAQAAGQQDSAAVAARPAPAPIQKVEIKGAAASYDARRNDTATKIVITQEDILRNGDTTIGEVLKRLP